jgi:hypothetical protein
MEFDAIRDAALLVLMFVVFGAPALAIAARIAIRPVLDAIATFRESFPVASQVPDPRIASLEADVRRLNGEVQRLSESEAFSRELTKGTSPESGQ